MTQEIIELSSEQIDKIVEYMELIGEFELHNQHTQAEKLHTQTLRYLDILEAFGNDPKKAADCWNNALKEARSAMDKVYEDMLAHIPKPTKEHYYDFYETQEEADAYKKKVGDEASKVYKDVLHKEFYAKFHDYKLKQLDTPKTLH